jgi:hypothetical protein
MVCTLTVWRNSWIRKSAQNTRILLLARKLLAVAGHHLVSNVQEIVVYFTTLLHKTPICQTILRLSLIGSITCLHVPSVKSVKWSHPPSLWSLDQKRCENRNLKSKWISQRFGHVKWVKWLRQIKLFFCLVALRNNEACMMHLNFWNDAHTSFPCNLFLSSLFIQRWDKKKATNKK